MNKKRTIVYIDGSNLYYGLLRDSTDKWLDLMLFVKSLLRDDHEVVLIKYFASRVVKICRITIYLYPLKNAIIRNVLSGMV